jgi:hypothetical protein
MKQFVRVLLSLLVLASCNDGDDGVSDPIGGVQVALDVKIKVGEFLYENIDTDITIEGYSAEDELGWTNVFRYEGGKDNIISIPTGQTYYRFTLNKWGVVDEQTFTIQQLFEHRVDGPMPVTYVFGGAVPARKLTSCTRAMEEDIDGSIRLIPKSKQSFEYDEAGRLTTIRGLEYNSLTHSFDEKSYSTVSYEYNRVATIDGYSSADDMRFMTIRYEYLTNGSVSKIEQDNIEAGVIGNVTLTYPTPSSIVATYTQSNGNDFQQTISYVFKNAVTDEVSKGGQQCSNSVYTFDKKINPFRHLGYLDFFLSNLSVNNKTDEQIQHVGCSFPELTVESYTFKYDELDYPTEKITSYKNGRKAVEAYTYK